MEARSITLAPCSMDCHQIVYKYSVSHTVYPTNFDGHLTLPLAPLAEHLTLNIEQTHSCWYFYQVIIFIKFLLL